MLELKMMVSSVFLSSKKFGKSGNELIHSVVN